MIYFNYITYYVKKMKQENLKKLQSYQMNILDEVERICIKHNLKYFIMGGNLIGAIRHKGFIPWDDDMDIAMMREDYDKFLEIATKEIGDEFFVDYQENNEHYYLPFAKVRLNDSIYEEPVQKDYKGHKGIWIDIFPLDNANKEDSLFIRLQTYLKESIHFIVAIKENVTSESNSIVKKVLKVIFKPITTRKLVNMQQKVMKWNKNPNASYCISFGAKYGMKKQTMLKTVFLPTTKLQYEDREYFAPGNYTAYLERVYPGYMIMPPEEKRITHNPRRIKFPAEEELKPEEV